MQVLTQRAGAVDHNKQKTRPLIMEEDQLPPLDKLVMPLLFVPQRMTFDHNDSMPALLTNITVV